MSRKPTGTITEARLADGTRVWRLRFRAAGRRERDVLHESRDCPCGCGGGWTPATARRELDNILARVQAGVWAPRTITTVDRPAQPITFHEYASQWLTDKHTGTLGVRISDETHARLLWALKLYLLPHFAKLNLDAIDSDTCRAFKAKLIASADELRRVEAAGEQLRHRNGRRARPLSPSSMRKVIDTLAQILDDAVEDGHLPSNPARGKRMRIRVPKPTRTFLEQDELAALLDAAGALDRPAVAASPAAAPGGTAQAVAALAASGKRPAEIAAVLGRSRATVSYHLRRLNIDPVAAYLGHRALCAALGYAGARVSELCDLRIGQLRLHDPDGARFHIPDAKTPTGVRAVEISPALVEILIEHIDRLRRAGLPTGPAAYAFPNTRGARMDRGRAGDIVRAAATAATDQVQQRGLPPLPSVTPHTLRRTYVSIALLASSFDIRFVMAQVGHADSAMTLDVYAQLQQRHQRQHGDAFDQLIAGARERLYGTTSDEPTTVPTEWTEA